MTINPYFQAVHMPVNHRAPEIGELFYYDELQRALSHSYLHGTCTILTCPRRAVYNELVAYMNRRGLGSARVTAEMLPG